MTTERSWVAVRDEACELFGDTPGAQLEQDIIEHFTDDPERVIRTIHRIAEAENIISRWAVVRSDLNRVAQADVTASDAKGRHRAVERAKQWIDNAGVHFDRADHVEAELFGDDYARGPLTAYADDHELRAEMLEHWRTARPRGEQAERDHEAWNAKCKHDRTIVDNLRASIRDQMTEQTTQDDTRRRELVPNDDDIIF